jgi:hypothetical protein
MQATAGSENSAIGAVRVFSLIELCRGETLSLWTGLSTVAIIDGGGCFTRR